MPIPLICSHCKTTLSAPDNAVGKTVRCPKCQGVTAVTASVPPPTAILANQLIACKACNRMIARTATVCPGCGAANTWIHPEIQRFIGACNSFTKTGPFQYFSQGCSLRGTASVKRGVYALGDYGIKAVAIGMLLSIVGTFTPAGLTCFLWTIGPLTLLAGLVILLLGMLQSPNSTDFVVNFSIDFSQDPPSWKSDDDVYWQEVKGFFFKPLD